jgi:hypothetical protein
VTDLQIRNEENRLRALFFAQRDDPAITELHTGLIDLFSVYSAVHPLLRKGQESTYPLLMRGWAPPFPHAAVGVSPIVSRLEAFVERLERFYMRPAPPWAPTRQDPNIVRRILSVESTPECGWFIAGGCVLRALLARDLSAFSDGDLDIFIYSRGAHGDASRRATDLARRLYESIASTFPHHYETRLSRTAHLVNICVPQRPPIQIVLRERVEIGPTRSSHRDLHSPFVC